MRRALAAFVVLALLPLGGSATAEPGHRAPAAKKQRKRCEVVVFTRRGKTVRRCRLKRRPAPAAVPHAPAPAPPPEPAAPPVPAPPPPAPPAPAAGGGTTPPPDEEPPPPPPRDPWFLTLYARDIGNGDFRLLPDPGTIPAGTLMLSYKNDDETAHDLRLRGLAPERAEELIFEASSTKELRRARLELSAGRYELRCGLLGHEDMRQELAVR